VDYQALQQELKGLEARKAELEQAIQAQRGERKKELIAEFKARLTEEGFDFAEICGKSEGKKGRRTSGSQSSAALVYKGDPNLSYIRGPIPGWMTEKMSELGLDSSSKEDRDRFKAEHMERRG
jgi:hypothetical protein